MGGWEFFDELEHVVVFPADDPVPPHLGRITRRKRHGNRVVRHVQADEQRRWGTGRSAGGLGQMIF
jgi:hypothetical protein